MSSDEIRIADKLFLGQEFLTWLYFVVLGNADEGVAVDFETVAHKDQPLTGDLQIVMGKRVTLRSVEGAGGAKVSLQGAGLDNSGEVLQAIRRGANIDNLGLEMAVGNRVYSFTLSFDGSISGVKLPDLFTEPETEEPTGKESMKPSRKPKLPLEEVIGLRMDCLDELEQVVDGLFSEFLARRLDKDAWGQDVKAILGSVSQGLQQRLLTA